LSAEDRLYKEHVLRRVIDGVAFMMLKTDSHVMRRLVLHDSAPPIDLATVRAAQVEANRLNGESRLTFALIADLTTFIHVADLLRIDFRNGLPRITLIELKTGRVNSMLLEQLEHYQPEPSSIDRVRHANDIDNRHRKQAERILRQRIRIKQIQDVLTYDEGIDTQLGCPIKLLGPTMPLDSYDHCLDELCDDAMAYGTSAATVQFCVHLGVACDEDHNIAQAQARRAATVAAIHPKENALDELSLLQQELEQVLGQGKWLKAWNLLDANLQGMSDRPFVLWSINPAYKVSLVERRLAIVTVLDLAGLIFLARYLGFTAALTTRKEAEEATRTLPRYSMPRWGNRLLRLQAPGENSMIMGGGVISRIINDLYSPVQVLKVCTKTS
jgi:hypothetical protein